MLGRKASKRKKDLWGRKANIESLKVKNKWNQHNRPFLEDSENSIWHCSDTEGTNSRMGKGINCHLHTFWNVTHSSGRSNRIVLYFYRLLSIAQSFIYRILFPLLIPIGIWPFMLMSLVVMSLFLQCTVWPLYFKLEVYFHQIYIVMCLCSIVLPWVENSQWFIFILGFFLKAQNEKNWF